jgi:hypothetical protein
LGLVGLASGLWARVIILDDALITFRVAENLAYGRGFVYNVGERVQVTTTPLYALSLAGGAWLFGSAPRAALVLNLFLATILPILTYDLGRRLAGRMTGLAGALFLSLAPLLVMAFSMESYLYVALILATLLAYLTGRLRLAAILIGLTGLVRGDGAMVGACVLGYDLLARRRLAWRLIIPAIGIPALWYIFATAYYGDPFPATLGAKVAQGEFNWLGQGFWAGFVDYWDQWLNGQQLTSFYLVAVLWLAGLGVALRAERPWLILLARDGLYIAAFVGLGVPAAQWYYAPLMPGVALLAGRGVQLLADSLVRAGETVSRRYRGRALPGPARSLLGGLALAGAIAILLTSFYPASRRLIEQNPDWKARIYPETGRWLAENTNAPANFATIDIGHLGYWSGRPIVDIVGLAQPDVAANIARGDFGYAIRHYRPDMVLIGFSWLPEIQSQAWFQADYAVRHYFIYQDYPEPLVLFSRRQGVKVQPPPVPATAIRPLAVDFNRQARLTGYQLNPSLGPGSPLNLTLFWQATAPIMVDFTVFVQLVDSENRLVAQRDSKPQDGFYGTRFWQPGEVIIDPHTVPLGPEIPPGEYTLLVGLYEVESGSRLQILDEAGTFQSDHLRIPGLSLRPLSQP